MNKKGFTLIELIVVITILAILGTIAFVSFKGYTADARNSVRSTDLSNIQKAIALKYEKSGAYVEPTNSKSLTVGGDVVGKYGSAGSNVLTSVGLSGGGTDPSTGEYYYYSVSGSNFNVLGFFEGDLALNTEVMAESLSDKSYKLYGDSPVYVTNSDLTPLSTDIADIDASVDVVFVGDDEKREIKSPEDLSLGVIGSCSGIYAFKSKKSGTYELDVNGIKKEKYCYMDIANGPSVKYDTLFNSETDRRAFADYFATNYTGTYTVDPAIDNTEFANPYPYYIRDWNDTPFSTNAKSWYCAYKLNKDFNYSVKPEKIRNSFEGLPYIYGMQGIFIGVVSWGDINDDSDNILGVRSESQENYNSYKEIYCNY